MAVTTTTRSGGAPFRLAHLVSHPIQYAVPLYRRLAEHPDVDLTVYFCSRQGVDTYVDPEFGRSLAWDVPLLDGYRHVFLRNSRRAAVGSVTSLVNLAIVPELVRGRYDALWVHSYDYVTHLLGLATAAATRTPILYRTESSLTYDRLVRRPAHVRIAKRIFLRTLFGRVGAFLAIGTRNREFFLEYGAPPERVFHVPYAVDNEFFAERARELRERRDELRRALGIAPDALVFLFAAKMVAHKCPLELLRAYARVRTPGSALVMVGDGPLREDAERLARELRLAVHFPGFVNQSRLPEYYALSDVFVRPDGVYKGDWGVTVNEAMASGLGVVASDTLGAGVDLIRDGSTGWRVRTGDVDELGAVLERLACDPEAARALGARAQAVVADWDYDACVDGIVAALRVVARRAGSFV